MLARIFGVLTVALLFTGQTADPRVAWLEKNAIRVRTIDPADTDVRDLEPLRAVIGDARVVMLGEGDHGDGSAFLAKTRLVRFLHERMGFDVIAFESGLYDCAKAWEYVKSGEPPRKAVARGVFRIWTGSTEVQPVMDYIGEQAKSAHPLELAGVDCQLTSTASEDFLKSDLAHYLSTIDPSFAKGADWDRVADVITKLDASVWETPGTPRPSSADQQAFVATIERWRAAIAKHDHTPATQPWSGAFWRQFLTSLRVFAELEWRTNYPDIIADPAVYTLRDIQMGKNLIWLTRERYPNRKIIVWAATFHNARNMRVISTSDPKKAKLYAVNRAMGEVAHDALGSQLYSLGFIAAGGEWARAFTKEAKPIPKPEPGSLEGLCARAGLDFAIVDLRRPPRGGKWLQTPMDAAVLGHVPMRADWSRVVDGVFFVKTMTRSHRFAE